MKTISIKKFNDEIENQLSELDLHSLRKIIKSFANEVKPIGRKEFLEKLSFSSSKKLVIDDDILEEIDGVKEVVESRFAEEPDWDDYDYDVEDPGPDEDLVEEISTMFDRVNAVFDYGNIKVARKAYEKLFSILELDDEYGRSMDSYDLENVDLKEIRARYLRSLYLSFSGEERVKMLMEKMKKMHSFFPQEPPSIQEIIEISSSSLPDWNEFLDLWISILKKENSKCTNAWLREAVFLKEGIFGLKKLSQSHGLNNPRIFYELVQALKDKNQMQEALDEAENAISILPENLPIRASIADQIEELAQKLKNDKAFCNAQWISFQEKPTLKKLIKLFNNEKECEIMMEKAVAVLENQILEKSNDSILIGDSWEKDDIETPSYFEKSLLLHGYFFAKKESASFNLVSKKKELGWSYGSQLQPIFIAICFFQIMPINKLREASKNFQIFWKYYFSSSKKWDIYQDNYNMEEDICSAYEKLKNNEKHRFDSKAIEWCFEISKKRISSIVSNQHRGAYDRAALLTGVCFDVLQSIGKSEEAVKFYSNIKNQFPRHTSFQKELKNIMGK